MAKTKKIENIIYPELFSSKYIYVYSDFNDELKSLIEESGYKKEFTRKYRKCLTFLQSLKQHCIQQNSFEKLSGAENLYSMRLKGEKNIRILFTFMEFENNEIAVLLYAFQEKDNIKRSSKTSYSHAIVIAQQRISEIQG